MRANSRSPLKLAGTALIAGLAMVAFSETARGAAAPSLLWARARSVAVHCQVNSTTTGSAAEFERALCQRVRTLARGRSRMPVTVVEAGDPAFIRNDTVLLLVHASVERIAGGHIIALAIRPYRPSGGEAEVYFGAPPTALVVRSGLLGPALDRQIGDALGEILPARDPARRPARPL